MKMVFTRFNIAALKKQAPKPTTADQAAVKETMPNPVAFLDARSRAEAVAEAAAKRRQDENTASPQEYGGPKGLEPTRYGDWEKAGRCFDF